MEEIIFTNSRGQSITIGSNAPYFLASFDRGAPKSTLITTKAPGQDGKTLEGQMLEERTPQIVVAIRAESAEQLATYRENLMSVFNPKLSGILQFTNEMGIAHAILCIVEDEPTVRTRSGRHQEVLIQLYCPDPYWRDTAETVKYLSTWIGDFEFPMEFDAAGTEFGHKAQSLIVNAVNPGDVPCGLRVELTADATVVNPYLLNIYTGEIIRVKKTLTAGEKIVISTEFGNESVTLAQGRTETNIFNWLDIPNAADFMQLAQGDNYLRYGADSGMDNLEMSVYYTPKFMGA